MSFFDAKEEVVEIKLTQEGKKLFSQGKFIPTYYVFYDDDITYDSTAAGISEQQNDSQTRIKSVPRMKIFDNYCVQTEYRKSHNKQYFNLKNFIIRDPYQIKDNPNKSILKYPLGTSDYTTQYAPAWNINVYKASVSSGSTAYVVGSSSINVVNNIPQVFISASYSYKKLNKYARYEEIQEYSLNNKISTVWDSDNYKTEDFSPFGDNKLIIEQESVPVLEVQQENSILKKEDYIMEVFVVETKTFGTQTEEILKPLVFNEDEENPEKKVSTYFNLEFDQDLLDKMGVGEFNIFDPYSNPFKTKEAEPCDK